MPKQCPSTVSYASALSQASADKRVEVLRLIGAGGSISQAGRDAGISYKAAWQAIDTLTNLAGVALVDRAVGGAGGGGARITAAGVQVLAAADQLEQARSQVLARLGQREGDALAFGMPSTLGQLSVRTSMRNQLPCSVQALEQQGRVMRVVMRLADGAALASRITRESAELLGLVDAMPVLALCKATAVAVSRAGDGNNSRGRVRQRNVLAGRASRVSRGETGDEVSALLDSGLQLVGFAAPASGLRSGSRVVMAFDESAVVIALAG